MTDNVSHAKRCYNIPYWSDGFFSVNEQGELQALPTRDEKRGISLLPLIREITQQNLTLPVLVRFNDILHTRVRDLKQAFADAMIQHHYQGNYTPAYPIKVNQQRRVVTELLRADTAGIGLEAGSKPELMAVLALSQKPGSLILCNGYKDREYIQLALIGRQLGHRVYIIVEKRSELSLILEEAARLQVAPLIGLRVRLASVATGKWQNSGGELAKFGLSAAETLAVVNELRAVNQLAALQLLHFHMGSQVANIHDIDAALRECARYYAELRLLGANLQCVDVGGGLGVDYEGTRSRNDCSINYTLSEYANRVVLTLLEICEEKQLPHPQLITECGRAMVAHHAVLIVNVLDKESATENAVDVDVSVQDPRVIQHLRHCLDDFSKRSPVEIYHDASQWMLEAQGMYTHGILSLAHRAKVEQLYLNICIKVHAWLEKNPHQLHLSILNELNEKLADKYFCNFSVFQSIPDVWAIQQIFPVMPVMDLQAAAVRRVTLHDLTCDSDGCIKQYVNEYGVEKTLPLPPYQKNQPYYLAIFLVGAYQEILGDIHNLFGDTDSVHVQLNEMGYELSECLKGDSVSDVLRYVHFEPQSLLASYENQLACTALSVTQKENCLAMLREGLLGCTYFED